MAGKPCPQGYGHGGHWCGPEYNCWLDPRSRAERTESASIALTHPSELRSTPDPAHFVALYSHEGPVALSPDFLERLEDLLEKVQVTSLYRDEVQDILNELRRGTEIDPRDQFLTPEQLETKYSAGNSDPGEHLWFPKQQWRLAVKDEDTCSGYWVWVHHQLTEERG